ncbi:MAG: hypothetical protein IJJ11_07460 [Methanosphaera sp.]|nr:hypothetical protein [Methanobrevibacter sp.]MBQ6444494.1 hypothetical protein [Methanosphaera sp.]
MTEMIICGLSMEMEMAREMGTVGKCIGCRYFEKLRNGALFCEKYDKILDEEKY